MLNVRKNILIVFGLLLPTSGFAQDSEITISIKTFGDWVVRCEQEQGSEKSCVMTSQSIDESSGQRIMQVNVAKVEKATQMTILLPLGVYLPANPVLQVEEFDPHVLEVSFCSREGCYVNMGLNQTLLDLLRKKENATLTMELVAGQKAKVPFTLNGFLDAYRAL
jgi:invasion protein IalB